MKPYGAQYALSAAASVTAAASDLPLMHSQELLLKSSFREMPKYFR